MTVLRLLRRVWGVDGSVEKTPAAAAALAPTAATTRRVKWIASDGVGLPASGRPRVDEAMLLILLELLPREPRSLQFTKEKVVSAGWNFVHGRSLSTSSPTWRRAILKQPGTRIYFLLSPMGCGEGQQRKLPSSVAVPPF
jgi:hypothetical protein